MKVFSEKAQRQRDRLCKRILKLQDKLNASTHDIDKFELQEKLHSARAKLNIINDRRIWLIKKALIEQLK